jgi:hypothetical protein
VNDVADRSTMRDARVRIAAEITETAALVAEGPSQQLGVQRPLDVLKPKSAETPGTPAQASVQNGATASRSTRI